MYKYKEKLQIFAQILIKQNKNERDTSMNEEQDNVIKLD